MEKIFIQKNLEEDSLYLAKKRRKNNILIQIEYCNISISNLHSIFKNRELIEMKLRGKGYFLSKYTINFD